MTTANSESLETPPDTSLAEAGETIPVAKTWLTPGRVRKLAIALSVYAALRILFFALMFPLFNNVDEKLHFLTIKMYAQGHLPGKDLPHIDDDFSRTFLPYWSPEYDHTPVGIDYQHIVVLYRLSPEQREWEMSHGYYDWKLRVALPSRLVFEAQGAPLYYVIAGAWYDVGTVLGLHDWRLAYWLRLINPISYGLLVWLSFLFMRRVYPERLFLCLSVPALIAVFPQDVFFGMNRDVLPPTVWAAALLLMVDAIDTDTLRARSLLWASFLVSLAFLLEVSNCVLYGTLAISVWAWWRRSPETRQHKLRVAAGSAVAGFFLPAIWMTRNFLVYGDLTGSKAKVKNFGWTVKPFQQMFHHPIFTFHGLAYFLVKLTRSVWHGDYEWYTVNMRSASADWFYVISSALMIVIVIVQLLRHRKQLPDLQRWAEEQALSLVAASVLFLIAISMAFDYHNHGYPSQLHPFFVSGRIISGALLPFVLIYASGFEWITNRMRRWIPPTVVLACLLLFITASEIHVRKPAFSSPYNFFALSAWRR